MNASELWIIGYSCLDRCVFPDQSVNQNYGGGAWWAGHAAHQHYRPTKIMSAVGPDWPEGKMRPGMRRKNLPTTQVELRYSSSLDLTERTIQVKSGAAQNFYPSDMGNENWLQVQYALLSTMLPAQQAIFLQALREYAPQAKIAIDSDSLFINDPLQQPKVVENFRRSDLVFMNRHEAHVLAGLIASLPLVIIKADAAGASLVSFGHEQAFVPAPRVVVRDTTGAGDVLAGTFLALLSRGYEKIVALSLAVTTASQFVAGERNFAR